VDIVGAILKARLWIDESAVDLDPFVEQLLSSTVAGAVMSLKGTEDMRKVEVNVDRGQVGISVNGREVPLTPFPNDIIAHTLTGFVSALQGTGKPSGFKIVLQSP